MTKVVLEVSKLHWLDVPHQEADLCAHGAVKISVAGEVLSDGKESDWCVSASALQLLRTLKADHIPSPDRINHLIEHCGHGMFASPDGVNVIITGCNLGIDFTVLHSGSDVTLQTAKGTKVTVPLREWASLVANFSDAVQAFYERSPKREPEHSTDAAGFSTFLSEWDRRRKEVV